MKKYITNSPAQTKNLAKKLAKQFKGQITALDNYPFFLEVLKQNAQIGGVSDRIKCLTGDIKLFTYDSI